MRTKHYYIEDNVKLGDNVRIGYGAYIEDGSIIGNDVTIGPHAIVCSGSIIKDHTLVEALCVIGHPAKVETQKWDFSATSPKVRDLMVRDSMTIIGEGSIVRSGSVIYKHVVAGKRLRTGHNVLIREHTTLGDKVIVGTQATLDGYIKVGDKSMIQGQCYLAQSVRIGSGVFIAPCCLFFDNERMVLGQGLDGATVEDFVRIGGGTKVLPRVNIGKYSMVGSDSLVTRDIPEKALAFGVPAKVQRTLNDKEIELYVKSITEWK